MSLAKPPEAFMGYVFKNPALLEEALTHKSHKESPNNQRLEFLGDAVLSLAISDMLMRCHPQSNEGFLTKKKAAFVSGKALSELAKQIKLDELLKASNTNKKNPRLLADAFEACLGAVYMDGGFEKVRQIIETLFLEKMKENPPFTDYKSIFQEWCQKKYQTNPTYRLKNTEGPEHKKIFSIEVVLNEKSLGEGQDRRKKQAEQMAALEALKKLDISFSRNSLENSKIDDS